MAMLWESDTVARYEALLRASAALALHHSIGDLMHVLSDRLHAVVPFEYMALVLHEAATDEMRLLVLEPRDLPKPDATRAPVAFGGPRSEEHTSELQSLRHLVCRLLLEKKK